MAMSLDLQLRVLVSKVKELVLANDFDLMDLQTTGR